MYKILRKILEELTKEQKIEMLKNLYDSCGCGVSQDRL